MELHDILEAVQVGEGLQWKNLQVFALTQPNGHAPAYALIDDLLDSRLVEISEVGDGGTVPTITVRNEADVDALILDGTELRGAKQNRMVNITVVAGKHAVTPVPVSCVEQGRWHYRSRQFGSAKRTVASKLRNRKAHMVSEALASGCRPATDQGGVWAEVRDYVDRSSTVSATGALDDVFVGREDAIDDVVRRFEGVDGYGAVVALNGEIIALDLLDHRDTFRKLWTTLLRGYAMDATLDTDVPPRPLTAKEVSAWMRAAADGATLTPHDVAGVGSYLAVRGPGVAGGVVVHGGRVVHVALFPETH